ncbi:MAG: iron-containing alcohol dehydrogenase [Candidatus Omnitrophica bacterium]|nr:iron-containing alcohol dehydrogenase [Candidatus Omnitrophota bacterium]
MIKKFQFLCKPEVIYGANSISSLPSIVKSLNCKNLLIVVDKTFSKTIFFSDILKILQKENIKFFIFDKIEVEPDTEIGNECGKFAKKNKCDVVCGIGGGSVLDTAKAASILITNDGYIEDYQGLNKVPKPGVPKIMIPTTAGTGSEVTYTAVFIRKDLKRKGGINSPYLYPDYAILDPVLTIPLPPDVTASTGLDAFCHAIESYISRKANFLTEIISLSSMRLIWNNIYKVYIEGEDIKARENMLYGSFLGGIGLANAGVTAVHSMSYPLGGRYGIPHGVGNAMLLPYVLDSDIENDKSFTIKSKFANIIDYVMPQYKDKSEDFKSHLLIKEIKKLNEKLNIPRLRNFNIQFETFNQLAEEALQVQVPIENNPYPITKEHIIQIYKNAY